MARRNDIDWDAVEKDVRAGSLSWAQMAEKHSVSSSQIRNKAKSRGWPRDLSSAIEARTKAKISAIDVADLIEQSATESAGKSAKLISEAIEQASDVAAGIVIKHRASARLNHDRVAAIEAMLDAQMSNAVEIKDVATVAQTIKTLVETRSKLVAMERQAFGIADESAPENPLTEMLRSMSRSSIHVCGDDE